MKASVTVHPRVRAPTSVPGDFLPSAAAVGQLALIVTRDDQHKARLLRWLSSAAPGADAAAPGAAVLAPLPG